jgi:hypothetical protein
MEAVMAIPTLWSLLAFSVAAIALYVFFGEYLRNWFRFRGVRLIVCPENYQPAAVKVDAKRAARWAALSGEAELRLNTCSRWPEKEGCVQECLSQIERSPETCALQRIVETWFEGKRCYFCRHIIEESGAVVSPQGGVMEWTAIAPEQVPNVFAVSDPVCRRCFLVESFRREHPEMVIERVHPAARVTTIPPTPNAVF